MTDVVHQLIDLLTLNPLDDCLFQGSSEDLGFPSVFGGQVIGQALMAAFLTVDSKRSANSLHAYSSDFGLLGTCLYPHGVSFYQKGMQVASLDHAVWFHRPFDISDWMLYAMDSPRAAQARGLNRGLIYDRQGRLVASAAQEGLIRRRSDQL